MRNSPLYKQKALVWFKTLNPSGVVASLIGLSSKRNKESKEQVLCMLWFSVPNDCQEYLIYIARCHAVSFLLYYHETAEDGLINTIIYSLIQINNFKVLTMNSL